MHRASRNRWRATRSDAVRWSRMEIQRARRPRRAATRAWSTTSSRRRPATTGRTRSAARTTPWSTHGRNPSAYRRTCRSSRSSTGTVVGIGRPRLSLQDNTHLADLEVTVLPEHRRRGIGRALYAAADGPAPAAERAHERLREVYAVAGRRLAGAGVRPRAGLPERARGGPPGAPAARDDPPRASATAATATRSSPGGTGAPTSTSMPTAEMRTRMNHDVPVGELDYEPVVMTRSGCGGGGAHRPVLRPRRGRGPPARGRGARRLLARLPRPRRPTRRSRTTRW